MVLDGIGRVRGSTPTPQGGGAPPTTPEDIVASKQCYIGPDGIPDVTAADVMKRVFTTAPIGRCEFSPEVSEVVRHAKDLATRVMIAALDMTMNPPRRSETGTGSSDPGNVVG